MTPLLKRTVIQLTKYSEAYPHTFLGIGLVSQLSAMEATPWNGVYDPLFIEMAYSNRSAEKIINPNFLKFGENQRSAILLAYYREKWKKYFDLYNAEYEALHPYSIHEEGAHTKNNDGEETVGYGKTIDETATDTGTVGNSGTTTDTSTRGVYGYNSINDVPSDTDSGSGTSNNTETRDLSGSRNIEQSGEDVTTKVDSEEYEYSVDKTGNLGFITTQELIRREFDIWATTFFDRVFKDIDDFIALKIY